MKAWFVLGMIERSIRKRAIPPIKMVSMSQMNRVENEIFPGQARMRVLMEGQIAVQGALADCALWSAVQGALAGCALWSAVQAFSQRRR